MSEPEIAETEIPVPSLHRGGALAGGKAASARKRIIAAAPEAYVPVHRLDAAFVPEAAVLASFLINALYLFGGDSLIALGGVPAGVTDELTRLGHRVDATAPGRELRQRIREGRHDRALLLTQALGSGTDAEILALLRGLKRAVRPGGLVCFHIFDRDQAWSLARKGAGGQEGIRFDPVSGRLSSRVGTGRDGGQANTPCARIAVKTWNRSEIQALLQSVGLRLERVYGDWTGAGADAGDGGRLIVVAAKPRRARRAL
jgi:hypothetical protein